MVEGTAATDIIQMLTQTPEIILIPAALWLGKLIKQSSIDDAFIPPVVIGLTGVIAFIVLNRDMDSFLLGIRSGIYTVVTHQSFKQMGRRKKRKKKTKKESKVP